jgi:hypothetical protein
MTTRVRWLVVLCVVFSSCYTATHYRGWMYQGGRLVDHGLLGRPRYEARFDPIALNRAATYAFTFSRFPAADAIVMLATPSTPPVTSIETLTTMVRIRVVDGQGQVLCDGSGSPAGRPDDHRLIATSSTGVESLWLSQCNRLELRTCRMCRLEITIAAVDPATPAVSVVPTIAGGGIELP